MINPDQFAQFIIDAVVSGVAKKAHESAPKILQVLRMGADGTPNIPTQATMAQMIAEQNDLMKIHNALLAKQNELAQAQIDLARKMYRGKG